MAKVTIITEINGSGTISIESHTNRIWEVRAGGTNLKSDAEAVIKSASHILSCTVTGNGNIWVAESIAPVYKTCPLYVNLSLEEVVEKLLRYYGDGDEHIVYHVTNRSQLQ